MTEIAPGVEEERRTPGEPVKVDIVAQPVPVNIVAPDPIPVEVTNPAAPPAATSSRGREQVQRQSIDPSLPAKTTFQQDLTMAGQRNINVMWEGTQRNIAMMVTVVALAVTSFLIMWPGVPNDLKLMAFTTLSNVFFAVTSVYFTRTNHTKTGGVAQGEVTR